MILELTVRLVKCERNLTKAQKAYWDLVFEVEAEDFPTQYIPVTIYAYELNVKDEINAVRLASSRVLPQQVGNLYSALEAPTENQEQEENV